MQTTFFFVATMAAIGVFANPAPSPVGVEVVYRDGQTFVREVPRSLNEKRCTNCVHVGGSCLIGEGNCFGSERASCTACGNRGTICVSSLGNCDNP